MTANDKMKGGHNQDEGKTVCQTDLREMQDHQAQRSRHGDLREPETQTETRLIKKGGA
jgi:hypothetical protein